MPYVREWIDLHGDDWLDKLIEVYKIDAVRDGNLVSLKYNQIESPMNEKIVQECRGMVVRDAGKNSKILAHPYNKFWNLGEHLADTIDWTTAWVLDKLDGSLCQLFHDDNRWQFASSGSPLGSGRYGASDMTFGQKFWQTFSENGMLLPNEKLLRECGFFFELIAPDNRIVCKYERPQLILHGARFRDTERECNRDFLQAVCEDYHWSLVNAHPIRSAEEALEASKSLNPVEREGFVVVDAKFNRVKIKSPKYVALHHLKDKFTVRGAMHLWKAGEISETLQYFPEMADLVMSVADKLEAACNQAWTLYNKAKNLPTRKEFAMTVKDRPWSTICFKLMDKNSDSLEDAKQILRASSDSLAESILEKVCLHGRLSSDHCADCSGNEDHYP